MKVKKVLNLLGLTTKDVRSSKIHVPGDNRYVRHWEILDSDDRESLTAYMFMPRVSKSQGFFTNRENEVFEFYNMNADKHHPTLHELIEWRNNELR